LAKELIGLMYSGGIDSVLCLKLLVEQNVTPIIFHVKTTKLTRNHERAARKNAKVISPMSPYYTIKTHTLDYNAAWTTKQKYFVYLDEWANEDDSFKPLEHVDKIAIGYFRNVGKRIQGDTGIGQPEIIKTSGIYNLPMFFPLKDKTSKEIDKMFSELPLEIQKNTVSSTRFYKHNGQTVGKPLCKGKLGYL
jgi:hypothetical protein